MQERDRHPGKACSFGRNVLVGGLGLLLLPLLHALEPTHASAAPPRPGTVASARPKPQKKKPAPQTRAAPPVHSPTAVPLERPAISTPARVSSGSAASPERASEATLSAPGAAPPNAVVKTDSRAGETTYTFGAQEVEGRLKSPQILYFFRRVRAQFDPAPLGHRSFMLELSDTRRHPALE